MAISPTANPNRVRNVFIAGIVIGAIVMLLISAVAPSSGVSKKDVDRIDERLAGIEKKLNETPAPTPESSSTPSALSISAVNKDSKAYIDRTVELTGKINSPHQGVGFILVDKDGTFLWVHTKDKIPTGTATVKGRVMELKDQISQWKNEPGWPDNDSDLTAKLRDEKVFLEADSVS